MHSAKNWAVAAALSKRWYTFLFGAAVVQWMIEQL
jgi:hypothetical protein